MFGLGMPELVVILVIALIIFGPSKLPEMARGIGKAVREFRKITTSVEGSFREEFDSILKDGDEPPEPKPKPDKETDKKSSGKSETSKKKKTKPADKNTQSKKSTTPKKKSET